MKVAKTFIDGVVILEPQVFGDHRGFFMESWNKKQMEAAGLFYDFVQDNHSLSVPVGTLRGLHYQTPPMAQDKLVRATRGRVFDVAVDLRPDSPTYRHWVSLVLDAAIGNQILVPKGFAHGFQTLVADCEVQYKVTAPYAPDCDRSIRYDDPAIGVDWPVAVDPALLSNKDRAAPLLSEQETGF